MRLLECHNGGRGSEPRSQDSVGNYVYFHLKSLVARSSLGLGGLVVRRLTRLENLILHNLLFQVTAVFKQKRSIYNQQAGYDRAVCLPLANDR